MEEVYVTTQHCANGGQTLGIFLVRLLRYRYRKKKHWINDSWNYITTSSELETAEASNLFKNARYSISAADRLHKQPKDKSEVNPNRFVDATSRLESWFVHNSGFNDYTGRKNQIAYFFCENTYDIIIRVLEFDGSFETRYHRLIRLPMIHGSESKFDRFNLELESQQVHWSNTITPYLASRKSRLATSNW